MELIESKTAAGPVPRKELLQLALSQGIKRTTFGYALDKQRAAGNVDTPDRDGAMWVIWKHPLLKLAEVEDTAPAEQVHACKLPEFWPVSGWARNSRRAGPENRSLRDFRARFGPWHTRSYAGPENPV
jgi:hypothetical protein